MDTPTPKHMDTAQSSLWGRLGLKQKAIGLAIILGTAPVLAIGATAYYFANESFTREISQTKVAAAVQLSDTISQFMAARNGDIQVLSGLPIIKNPKVRAITTSAEKEAVLDRFLDAYLVYDSIAVIDLKGDVITQSIGDPLSNQRNQDYFQKAIKAELPIISNPEISSTTGKIVIYFATPIKDKVSGKTIAIVRARLPVNRLEEVIQKFANNGDQYHVVDKSGKFFLATDKTQVGRIAKDNFQSFSSFNSAHKQGAGIDVNKTTNSKQFIAYSPLQKLPGVPLVEWDVLIANDIQNVFAPLRQLLFTLGVGVGISALLVAVLAAYLADRATKPILASAEAVGKIGQGQLDTRLDIKGTDELATLGDNINLMAEQIQTSLLEQQKLAQAQLEAQAEIARQQEEASQAQLEAQAEIVRQQTEAAETERQRSQALQMELLELLQNVGGASEGDLTVRADVSAGEIGIVADFFNSIVESLRDIVSQVKESAGQVNISVGSNEVVMGQLADQAQSQAHKITDTLKSVELMALSIKEVAENARQASKVSGLASKTAENGGETIDRTVESILQLRDTVAETAKKVKRLGESSQQISKVVSLINQIALQTNLLAINASIEAARAGEEGRGFAVVAEEVGALAAQSAAATKEIEGIVDAIQRETSEVVNAMENGTTQVVEGTRQVNEAKESLNQIVKVSREIDDLLKSISSATVSQTETSQVVKLLMEQITESSEQTSNTSRQVSSSLQETVAIAQQLQASVGTFKLEE